MKKCVRCGARYDDAVRQCPDCQLYLIQDTTGDMQTSGENLSADRPARNPDSAMSGGLHMAGSAGSGCASGYARPGRGRVEPVDDPAGTTGAGHAYSGHGKPAGGFQPSGEPARASAGGQANPNSATGRRRIRRRNLIRALRRYMPVLRYVVIPLTIILAFILFIAQHWHIVYGIIQCCVIGGIAGGGLLTWISAAGHHYTVEATIVGVIGGMVLACILSYNLFGAASMLGEMIAALSPCIIVIAGIIYLIRSLR